LLVLAVVGSCDCSRYSLVEGCWFLLLLMFLVTVTVASHCGPGCVLLWSFPYFMVGCCGHDHFFVSVICCLGCDHLLSGLQSFAVVVIVVVVTSCGHFFFAVVGCCGR